MIVCYGVMEESLSNQGRHVNVCTVAYCKASNMYAATVYCGMKEIVRIYSSAVSDECVENLVASFQCGPRQWGTPVDLQVG